MQTTLQIIYKTFYGNKKKERFETILEPLQAVIQIAFLSYYPIGSKLTIQNNILHIQAPCYSQSVTRWYNNDTQEDLFYLFNIFCRFKKFYTDVKVEHSKLFDLLISLAKKGINNLIRTYNQTDKTHVLHTLHMYKNMLDGTNSQYNSNAINLNVVNTVNNSETNNIVKYTKNEKKENKKMNENGQDQNEKEIIKTDSETLSSPHTLSSSSSSELDIDSIFIKISVLYSDEILRIVYNVFIQMESDDTNYIDYSNGLNMILHPTNIRIKKWIDENIVF